MGYNAIVCGKNSNGVVENTESTSNSLHVINHFDLGLVGNTQYGPTNRTRGFTFGRRSIVNNTLVTLWNGPTDVYVFPTVGQQMKIVSTSTSDAPAGIGARTITLNYLDSNYVAHTEVITLNGTTAVNTVATDIFRINELHVQTKGTNLTAVGAISLTNLAGSVTYAFMEASTNSARQSVFTVPAGVTGYITHWQCSSGSSGNHFGQIRLVANCYNGVRIPDVLLVQDEQGTQNGGSIITFPTPIPIPEKTDVALFAISDASNANVIAMGAIMGYFETNI